MEEDCNAVMRGIGSLPLLFHLRFWPHSSRSRNVCRWVDRYLGRGFWQCEPKPPPLSLAIIPPRLEDRAILLLARTGGIHAEFHPDSSSAARRFRLISVNNRASSRNGRVAGPISSTTDLIPRTRVYGRGFELFWRRLDNLDGS